MMSNTDQMVLFSVSAVLHPDSDLCGSNGLDNDEFNKVKKILDKLTNSLIRHAVGHAYKIVSPIKNTIVTIDPRETLSGIIKLNITLKNNAKLTEGLKIVGSECNDALFSYIEFVMKALEYEEKQCSVNVPPKYRFAKNTNGVVIDDDTNTIKYGIKGFTNFVKSVGKLLYEIHSVNDEYRFLISSETNSQFLHPVSTFSTGVLSEKIESIVVKGRIVTAKTNGNSRIYEFSEYGSLNKMLLCFVNEEASKILMRVFKEEDFVAIRVKPYQFHERDKKLKLTALEFVEVLTKTHQEREKLKSELMGTSYSLTGDQK